MVQGIKSIKLGPKSVIRFLLAVTQLGGIWVVDSNAEALDIAVGKDAEVHVVVLTGQVFKPEYQSLSEPGWSVFIRQIR